MQTSTNQTDKNTLSPKYNSFSDRTIINFLPPSMIVEHHDRYIGYLIRLFSTINVRLTTYFKLKGRHV